MVNKTLFSDVNVLDYVAPDEPIAMIVETIDYDSCIFSDSDKEKIQDALNSINNSYGLLLKKINKEGTSNGVKELKPIK